MDILVTFTLNWCE